MENYFVPNFDNFPAVEQKKEKAIDHTLIHSQLSCVTLSCNGGAC